MNAQHGAVHISPNHDRLMTTAAELFVTVAEEAIAGRGRAHIALTGGSTPRSLYQLLATPAYQSRIDWSRVEIWFGDERTVPPNHPESNYGMADAALLSHVPLPASNIHRMEGAGRPVEVAAQRYSDALSASFALAPGMFPRFDLIWLGMGPDGHCASLFPGTAALDITDRTCVANHVPQLQTDRITLTFPVLNNAARVAFLVAGEEKAGMVARVLEDRRVGNEPSLPSQRIHPTSGQLLWLLDIDAAGQLQQ